MKFGIEIKTHSGYQRLGLKKTLQHLDALNGYIEEKLKHYKEIVDSMCDDRKVEWEPLDKAFIEVMKL